MEKGEMNEIKRHFDMIAEGLRHDIRQAVKGIKDLYRDITILRHEMKLEFNELKATIQAERARWKNA